MKWIGLTGGIASGKSTASKILRELGADVVDADQLAREAVAPGGPALRAVAQAFGRDVLDASGHLNRKYLAALVFADPAKRRALEAIVHPRVRAACASRRRELEAQGRAAAVYDVPLLFEKNLEGEFDVTVAIACRPETQKARLMARDGLSEAEADARIAAQLPMAEKARRADVTIMNDGSLEDLRERVAEFWKLTN